MTKGMGRRGGEAATLLCLLMLSAVWRAAALSLIVSDVECVYEYVFYKDDTVSGNFVVIDHDAAWSSGRAGIDFTVTSPEGNTVQSLKGSFGEKFEFKVPTNGIHKFCFHNPWSAPEAVSFDIHVGHIPKQQDLAKDEHLEAVNAKIAEVREALTSVTLEQRYLKARGHRHRRTSESTRKLVMRYTVGEYMLLAALSGLQALYIRRLFNKSARV
ncbi:transmembrane emp24 domain-containing protein p24beta3-like [Salvia miltiorrhiza]|uniref:transmembrane emp24 domain-containing protein p24beta3-like n=1 Tax=Salvia miltiorrhiza TaxID=226208 RepID=UPI0025AC05CE|nr:transmembrane emp24 domain-containing protein p24beta3-like [Salvia miltiorrhiza]